MSLTHEFRNFDLLKKRPLDTSPELWNLFLAEMDSANNFEQLDHPVQLDIELNTGCNMACPFCLHGYTDIKNKNMKISQLKKCEKKFIRRRIHSLALWTLEYLGFDSM